MRVSNRLLFSAGVLSAFAAILLSAFLVFLRAISAGAFESASEAAKGFFVICLFTFIPAGLFGFLAGLVGGAWLSVRAGSFRSTTHLVAEAAILGITLSLVFPFLHWALGWGGGELKYSGFNVAGF
jgi:hypothetical protein